MTKRPSYQWYPGDFRRDTAVQSCSFDARALWREMLDIMHDGEPYGHLTGGGVPIEPPELSRMVGLEMRRLRPALAELERKNVLSRTAEGVIYSRRMVRDEDIRSRRAAGGKLGGNPALTGGPKDGPEDGGKVGDKVNLPANLEPTPAVCSLQSPEKPKKTTSAAGRGGWPAKFADAWMRQYGGTANVGAIGKQIKPIVEQHGEDEALATWIAYLAGTDPQFASPAAFAQKYGVWRSRAAPTEVVSIDKRRVAAWVHEHNKQAVEARNAAQRAMEAEGYRGDELETRTTAEFQRRVLELLASEAA